MPMNPILTSSTNAAKRVTPSVLAFPLTFSERDHKNALTWTRQGVGPHITPLGFEGDGYEARYRATASIPTWLSSATGKLTMHCTAAAYQVKHRSTSREPIVYAGSNDATANPKLELAAATDTNDPNLSIYQIRAFTTSAQASWTGRPGWKFEFRFPVLTEGANQIRPQYLLFLDADTVLVGGHYQDTESRVYKVRISDAAVLGSFTFGLVQYRHVSSIARRSNGDVWVTDYQTLKTLQLDLDASFASGTAVILNVYDTTVLTGIGAIEFVTVSGTEYAVLGQYATTGTPYIYVVPASLLGTGTFVLTDRYKRFDIGLFVQGYTMNAGKLYVSRNQLQGGTTPGGYVQRYDLVTAITSSADGAALVGETSWPGPARYVEDIKFHPTTGHLWMPTEGATSVGSDEGALSIWSTPLGQPIVENHYTVYFNGVSTVTIKINGRLAQTRTWAINRSVAAITVGGPPTATAGMQSGFFAGIVRNVVWQNTEMTTDEYNNAIAGGYEPNSLEVYNLTMTNPGLETGNITGWTIELGDLQALSRSSIPSDGSRGQPEGLYCFYPGNTAQSIARQRLDLLALTGLAGNQVDTGNTIWAKTRWQQTSFNGSDRSNAGIRALNASQVQISQTMSASVITPHSLSVAPWFWYRRCFSINLPNGTRYIDEVLQFDRTAGTSNDGYIDDVSMVVYRRPLELRFDTTWSPPLAFLRNADRSFVSGPKATALWHKAKGHVVRTPSAGSYYFETVVDSLAGSPTIAIGVAVSGTAITSASGTTNDAGDGGRYQYFNSGQKRSGGVYSAYGASFTTGDVIGMSIEAVSGNTSVRFYKNGVDQGEAFSIAGTAGNWDPHVCSFANTTTDFSQLTLNSTLANLPVGFLNWATG